MSRELGVSRRRWLTAVTVWRLMRATRGTTGKVVAALALFVVMIYAASAGAPAWAVVVAVELALIVGFFFGLNGGMKLAVDLTEIELRRSREGRAAFRATAARPPR